MDIKVRGADPLDAALIADFNARLAWETEHRRLDPQRVLAGVRALLGDVAKGAYFLAEVEQDGASAVAGQLLITYEWSDWRNGNFWWIQSVYVDQPHRGAGVFRALYRHVESLARTGMDVCGLRLYVEQDNAAARQTYARLGMQRTSYEIFELDFVLPAGH